MSSRRMRWVLAGALLLTALAFIIIAFSGFSLLGRQSHRLVELRLQNHTAETQLANLPEVKKQVDKYGFFNQVAKTVLPSDKDQAQAVLDIFQMANDSGISIASLTFPASNLGAAASNAASASAKSVISQASPVNGIPGLYSIPITITPQATNVAPDRQATYAKFLTFLQHIENNRRTAQITQISVTPNNSGDLINFVVTVNLFIKP